MAKTNNKNKIMNMLISISSLFLVLYHLFNLPNSFYVSVFIFILIILIMQYSNINWYTTFYSCLTMSIPLSFINIYNTDYGRLPISWYNIFFLIISLFFILDILLKEKHIKKKSISFIFCSFLFVVALLFSVLQAPHLFDGMKSYIIILSTIILVLITIVTKIDLHIIKNTFIISVIISALALYLQIVIYFLFKLEYGRIAIFPGRIAFSALFSDFSFLALYLACGAVLYIPFKGIKNRLIFLFITFASVFTSARTGIVALLFAYLINSVFYEKNKEKKIRNILFIIIIGVIGLYVFNLIRGGENIYSNNGRFNTYNNAIQNFKKYPIWGTGLGVENYNASPITNSEYAHNTFLQLLAQTGAVGFTCYCIYLLAFFKFCHKASIEFILASVCLITGSLFIPDIMNSRFMTIVFIMSILSSKENQKLYNIMKNIDLSNKIVKDKDSMN